MAANINELVLDFRRKVERLLEKCAQRGIEMRPYFTLRTPFEQAKLWRQSRSKEEIQKQIEEFKSAGADFLAVCLESVGPQHGDHVTDSLPGFSWHQWGEAVDCFWVVDGTAEWSSTKKVGGVNGYRVYVEEAVKLGLDAGGLWRKLKDWPHIQFRSAGNAGKIFSLEQINDEMKKRFGN
jgi:peptidoglycan L-alanyl-D-glutamate endopeptidase CwlK